MTTHPAIGPGVNPELLYADLGSDFHRRLDDLAKYGYVITRAGLVADLAPWDEAIARLARLPDDDAEQATQLMARLRSTAVTVLGIDESDTDDARLRPGELPPGADK